MNACARMLTHTHTRVHTHTHTRTHAAHPHTHNSDTLAHKRTNAPNRRLRVLLLYAPLYASHVRRCNDFLAQGIECFKDFAAVRLSHLAFGSPT